MYKHRWAAQGRGASLQAVVKPLVPTKTGYTWKKGKPAYREQLQQIPVGPQATGATPTQTHERLHHQVHKHWMGPPAWGQFLVITGTPTVTHAADLLQQTMRHQLQEAHPCKQPMMRARYNTGSGCSRGSRKSAGKRPPKRSQKKKLPKQTLRWSCKWTTFDFEPTYQLRPSLQLAAKGQ